MDNQETKTPEQLAEEARLKAEMEAQRQCLNKVDHPDGIWIRDGKIQLFGYSEPLPEDAVPGKCVQNSNMRLELEPRNYSWCSCGHSKTQPWCDNSHREEEHCTNRKSYKFRVDETLMASMCMCRQTKVPPFCDGTHNKLDCVEGKCVWRESAE